MNRTTATDHTPGNEPAIAEHPTRNDALALADEWIDRHRRHGCDVTWFPHGRIVARHYRHQVAAVLVVELDP